MTQHRPLMRAALLRAMRELEAAATIAHIHDPTLEPDLRRLVDELRPLAHPVGPEEIRPTVAALVRSEVEAATGRRWARPQFEAEVGEDVYRRLMDGEPVAFAGAQWVAARLETRLGRYFATLEREPDPEAREAFDRENNRA